MKVELKHPLAIRWFHWIHLPILTIMVWSGALIYWANPVYSLGPILLYNDPLFESLGLARGLAKGMAWHFLFGWLFAINGLLYVLYSLVSGQWRHIVPGKGVVREAWQVVLHDLRLRKEPLPRRKFNGAQKLAYSGIVVMGFLSLLTGLAIYKPVQLSWMASLFGGYEMARFFHFWLTVLFCAFFLVHILQVIRAGWNNLRAMLTGYEVAPVEETSP